MVVIFRNFASQSAVSEALHEGWDQVPDNRDGSRLIVRLGIPRTNHPVHDIPHVVITVNYIDDNLLDLALGQQSSTRLGQLP